jgi:hypothetical protein
VNLTFSLKYNVQQVSSDFSHHHGAPILDLSSEVERELNSFYNWSLVQVNETIHLMTKKFFSDIEEEDSEYFAELAKDCKNWFFEEGEALFQDFKQKLTPFFIHDTQFRELKASMERLMERWNDLRENIQSVEEFEDIYNWLLDLPYLLKKRLEVFGLISNYRTTVYSQIGPVIQQSELKTKINPTSPLETCLSYIFYKGCAI